MLFDKNGIYYLDDAKSNPDYDFAIDIMNGTIPNNGMKSNYSAPKLYDLDDALKKGNAFPNLYDVYKNYRPREIEVKNAREKALLDIQMLEFSINDLNLYLDLHPDDRYVYQIFEKYVGECKQKKDIYTRTYGPLMLSDLTDEFEWSKGVWPWEEGMM